MTENYFSAKNKVETAQLFVHNLLWGLVEIDYDKFSSSSQGKDLSGELYDKITKWDNEVLCGDDDPNFVPNIVDWIYDYIIKGRAYGAIKGKMIDETYDKRIAELEKENSQKDEKISDLTYERDQAVATLAKLQTTEPPLKKDFSALR
jgi:hypothetical protein